MEYKIDLDNFCEELFFKLENISDDGIGHECSINAKNKEEAFEVLSKRLKPFFIDNFQEDDNGSI